MQNGRWTCPHEGNPMQNGRWTCPNVANTMQNDKFKFQTVANTRQMVATKKSKKKPKLIKKKPSNYFTPFHVWMLLWFDASTTSSVNFPSDATCVAELCWIGELSSYPLAFVRDSEVCELNFSWQCFILQWHLLETTNTKGSHFVPAFNHIDQVLCVNITSIFLG